jgi:hypothetical protein
MNASTTAENLALTLTLTNDIDALYVLDQEVKTLEKKVKKMKEDLANKYGEGLHEGSLHGVSITLVAVQGSVDYAKLCAKHGITEATLDTFRKDGRVDIRVSPKK